MIESVLLLLGKKFAFGFVNLLMVVAVLSWLMSKVQASPKLRLLVWSGALGRFFVDIFWRHESALAPRDLTGEGVISVGISAPEFSIFRLMASISKEELSFGDVLQVGFGNGFLTILASSCLIFGLTSALCTISNYSKLMKTSVSYPIIGDYQGTPIRLCDSPCSPYVIGFEEPSIIIPADLLSRCTQLELQAVLAHEQAHIKRRDHLTVPALALLGSLFRFATPLRRVLREVTQAMELDCDQRAAKSVGRRAVLGAMKKSLDCFSAPVAAVPSFGALEMGERIQALVSPRRDRTPQRAVLLAIAGFLILGIRIL